MIDDRLLGDLLEVQDLPTLPEVMTKILDAVEDEQSSADDLTHLLECDHAISARLLRLANSAFYGLRFPADSIQRAVVVVGFDAIRHLALATSVFDAFSGREQFALDPQDFWMHSLGTAKTAQLLCKRHCPVDSPEGVFTAGLLHDIGKYLLALVAKDTYRQVVQTAQASGRLLRDVELEMLHTTHTEVGTWIADRWRLPDLLKDTIANLAHAATYSGRHKTEVAAVALANDLSRMAGIGCAGDPADGPLDNALLESLGLTAPAVNGLIEELPGLRNDMRDFLALLKEQ